MTTMAGLATVWAWALLLSACAGGSPGNAGAGSGQVAGAVPSPPATTPTPTPTPTPVAWDGRGDFELVISSFHFETGTQVARIGSDGRIDDILVDFEEIQTKAFCAKATSDHDRDLCKQVKGERSFIDKFWRRATYPIAPAALDDLRARLVAAQFEALAPSYKGDDGDDGVTTDYRLQVGGKTYVSRAYGTSTNGEPDRLLAVKTWLRDQQAAAQAIRDAAPVLPDADYRVQAAAWGVANP